MTSTELSTLRAKAKLTLRLNTNAFDDEIDDLIKACEKEMLDRKAMNSAQLSDPRVIRAIMTYCRAYFGETENQDRLIESYRDQCAELMNTSIYTEWGD